VEEIPGMNRGASKILPDGLQEGFVPLSSYGVVVLCLKDLGCCNQH